METNYMLVNKIIIRPDGVYVSYTHSYPCQPCHPIKSQPLTDLYLEYGREALDRRIIEMMADYSIMLQGRDRSISRYRCAEKTEDFQRLHDMYVDHMVRYMKFKETLNN